MTTVGEEAFGARLARLTGAGAPSEPALLDDAGAWTWADVAALRADLDATWGQAGGAPAGVAIVLRQDAATVGALLATLASGRWALLLSPLAADRELAAEVGALGGLPVLAHPDDWARPGLAAAAHGAGSPAVAIAGDGTLGAVAAEGAATSPSPSSPWAPEPGAAVVVRTSGTTGAPQRVAVTWDQLDAVGRGLTVADPGTASGVTITVLPMYSIGAVVGLAGSVWRGRPTAILQRFEPRRWAELVRDHRPRQVGIPPAGFRALLDADIPADWLRSVRGAVTGSAPMDLPAVREFVQRYDIAILNQYGSTEFGGPVLGFALEDWPEHGASKLGSVGRPLRGVRVRVVDPETREPSGPVGLLQVDQGDGWVQTTDLAEIDADGFTWIKGRADDVIVRGGFKVPPDEVERALVEHPDVLEAIVVGLPDERLGQVPAAAVVLRAGAAATEEELLAFARDRLTAYMVPVAVRPIAAIPRNEIQKPLRREVVALLAGAGTP